MLRQVLLWLANRSIYRTLMLRSAAARKLSMRFVAGEMIEQGLAAARALNEQGFSVSLDYLGENVTNAREADAARDVYIRILNDIERLTLNANVSVKLTQLGLDLSVPACESRLNTVVAAAARHRNFVRVDMESSAYTERTLDVVRRVHATLENVGAVIQSYLYRSEKDAEQLLADRIRIRLCKGAYNEPPEVAFPEKADVDANYVRLMQKLLPSGIYHGVATHDPKMIAATREFAAARGISRDAFEFQMLYGVRRDLQSALLRDGYRVRIYMPFGSQWLPYLTRRLAERPANIMFFVRSLFRG